MPDSEESAMPNKAELGLNAEVSPKAVSRRSLFRKLGIFLGAGALAALTNPRALFSSRPENLLAKKAEADASAENLTAAFRRFIETKFTVDDVGYRISNAFTLNDGFDYQAYQGLVFQRVRETGEIRPWNTLDVLHDKGLDSFLDDYNKSGVTIPAHVDMDDKSGGNVEVAFNNRIKAFGVNPKVEAFARALRTKAEIGVPTSPTKNYGSYEVTRFQRIAIQEWVDGPQKGLIQRILAGSAFARTGLVPRDALLATPDLNFGNFSAQPEQPVKVPETTVNFPPSKNGNRFDSPGERERLLSLIKLVYIEKHGDKDYVALTGRYVSVRADGDKIIVTAATNEGSHEIIFEPKDREGLRFVNGSFVPFYNTSDPETAFRAINHYAREGDPVQVVRYFKGTPVLAEEFSTQQFKVWR